MADWLSSMQRTYEYYIVDPNTWKDIRMLKDVKSCTINWDYNTETLGSATIDITESIEECYVRVYMITIQNGVREKHPLGTFLVQTPSTSFDGKAMSVSMDAYTPLIELKENPPPIGFSILKEIKGSDGEVKKTIIMDEAYRITRERARAPVVKPNDTTTLYNDFVANTDDTWITYLIDLIANAKYEFGLDELGRILYLPKQETAALQPVWTYTDDNSSILYPDIDMDHDMYGIPNVVEVIYSGGTDRYYARVVNDDPNSPISTVNRGREITYRVPNPELVGIPTEAQVQEYAETMLKELSSLEYSVSYTHGYCPVRIGDCVRLNYTRYNLNNVKAKVVSQSIKCDTECSVTERAVFTIKLWR